MTSAQVLALVLAGVGGILGGGALVRWIVPTTRRMDVAVTQQTHAATAATEAATDKAKAETKKVVADEVGSHVATLNSALAALGEAMRSSREDYTARDERKTAELSEVQSGGPRATRPVSQLHLLGEGLPHAGRVRPSTPGGPNIPTTPTRTEPPSLDDF
jgi:hypothetical protein